MTFEIGTEQIEGRRIERSGGQFIEAMQDTEAHGNAAAEAAGAGDVPGDGPSVVEGCEAGGGEKRFRSGSDHAVRNRSGAPHDRHAIVQFECHTEAVESRTEIRAGGGDAHDDFIHIKRPDWRKRLPVANPPLGRVCLPPGFDNGEIEDHP